MSDSNFLGEVLNSEVAFVKCKSCGNDAPVNVVYLPYLNGSIERCKQCRCSGALESDL